MAITATLLGSGADTAAADPFTTATTITPSANRLVLVSFLVVAGTLRTATLTGCGLTWEEVVTDPFFTEASPLWRVGVFRSMGASPSTGALTFDFTGSITGFSWSAIEFDGVDTGGTNGSAAIVQAVASSSIDAGTSHSVTLAAFGHANNATYGAFGVNKNEDITPGSGFTEGHDLGHASPTARVFSEYQIGNDTSVDCSWTTSGAAGGVAVEIKAAAAGGAFTLNADSGSYGLTGQASGVRAGRQVSAVAGSYAITGQAAGVRAGRRLSAVAGAYVITGQAATLTYGSAAGGFTLTADPGVYAVTGQAAVLRSARKIAAVAGSYALTGQSAGVAVGRRLSALVGSYTITGQSATFRSTRTLTAAPGSYSVTGSAATFVWSGAVVQAAEAEYVITVRADVGVIRVRPDVGIIEIT